MYVSSCIVASFCNWGLGKPTRTLNIIRLIRRFSGSLLSQWLWRCRRKSNYEFLCKYLNLYQNLPTDAMDKRTAMLSDGHMADGGALYSDTGQAVWTGFYRKSLGERQEQLVSVVHPRPLWWFYPPIPDGQDLSPLPVSILQMGSCLCTFGCTSLCPKHFWGAYVRIEHECARR